MKEKEFNRQRDAPSVASCRWRRSRRSTLFQRLEGRRKFADLFEGKRQLLVYLA
jgi:predicted dithiol-disulfide oxidoreductase (DUF899 family)